MKKLSCILILAFGFLVSFAQQGSNASMAEVPETKPAHESFTNSRAGSSINPGVYLSFRGLVPQVLSALAVLTAVFGMGTGGTPPLWTPGNWRE